jgi:hypothetical protein
MDCLEKIRNRQLARLLTHLQKTGRLTIELEKDLKRAYRYVFEDIETIINNNGLDKDNKSDR